MALPKAIQEQADRAEAMLDQMTGVPQQAAGQTQETNPAPQEPQVPQPPQEPQEFTPPVEAHEPDYKGQFLTLQGKYNAEVSRLMEENRRLRDEVDTRSKAPAIDPKEAFAQAMGMVVEGEIDNGFDPFSRLIEHITDTTVNRVRQEIKPLNDMVQSTAQSAFEAAISARVPNWQQIDSSPQFNTFLDAIEPLTGMSYRDIGVKAFHDQDATRAAMIYQRFIASQQQQPTGGIPQAFISPSRTAAPAQAATPGVITREELDAMAMRVVRGEVTEAQYNQAIDQYMRQVGQ